MEGFEQRLLTDATFIEEFDVVVDEISDSYVAGDFQGEEKERVERYFLKSPDRRDKVKFMCELRRQVPVVQGERTTSGFPTVVEPNPTLFERAREFFRRQSLPIRTATTLATLILTAGLAFWLLIRPSASPAYVALELNISSADRSSGSEIKKVTLPAKIDELRIKLNLPSRTPPPKSYRAVLRGESVPLRQLPITEQNSQSLIVVVPADELARGTYAIELYALNEDGSEETIRGSYLFAVE